MRFACLLFFLTTLGLSELHFLGKLKRGNGRQFSDRNSVKLERGIIAKRIKHEGHIAQQGYNNGTVKLHLGDESSANENVKRIKHEGHIAQQGYNNGTVKLHLGDESSANENAKRLQSDRRDIVQRGYYDESNALQDESDAANEFSFGENNGEKGNIVQEGTNKGDVEEAVTKRHAPMAKRLNDPADSYLFKLNNGSIGQQGENLGGIHLLNKPQNGTIVQQGLNQGTLDFTDKRKRSSTYGTKDKFTFKENNGTIAQQGQSVGQIELTVRDESGRNRYAKRRSNSDQFKFAANNGSIEQQGANTAEVTETFTRDFHPNANRLNDPKDYVFRPNNGTILQQGLNKGTIKLQGKPNVGNIPQEGKNEGKILYNGKQVTTRDLTEGKQFTYAGTSGTVIDQKGTNTGTIKDKE